MPTMLAGHLPLQEMISRTIASAREKLAAAPTAAPGRVAKALEWAGQHKLPLGAAALGTAGLAAGGVALKRRSDRKKQEAAQEAAKTAGIDLSDPEEVEKLAEALEALGDTLTKKADSIENGGEGQQGGVQLLTNSPVSGRQSYNFGGSKTGKIPLKPGMQADPSQGPVATQMANNYSDPPGGNAKSKMASVRALQDALEKRAFSTMAKGHVTKAPKETSEAPKTAAVDYILGKLAESPQGGMTLDSPSETGPHPPTDAAGGNDVRRFLRNNKGPVDFQKIDGKRPQKRMLSEVLTEPAFSKNTDPVVHENLRNATKGGVKIAAAKALLQRIKEAGCTCNGAGSCRYCKMTSAMKAQAAQ